MKNRKKHNLTLWCNATIITMDRENPRAEALITENEKIIFVGTTEEAEAYLQNREGLRQTCSYRSGGEEEKDRRTQENGPEMNRIDLAGKTVVPGFNDNHVHAVMFGEHLLQPDISGMNKEEIVAQLKSAYKEVKPGQLVLGYGWDYPSCPDPSKEFLDTYFPDNPVMLVQFSGHGQWLNSRALALLGISATSGRPRTGYVERRNDGEPTGIVREMTSSKLVRKNFASIHFSKQKREIRLSRALDEFKRLGITSVQDNTWFFPTVFSLRRLKKRSLLTCRFSCWSSHLAWWSHPTMAVLPYDRQWIRRGPIKHFLDGTFSTKQAWLWEPYADEADNYGRGVPASSIEKMLIKLARRNKQGAFHAIGDRAVTEFLDAYEKVLSRYPELSPLRIRIEHAQLVKREDMKRLADFNVLVAAQPSALNTPEKDAQLLGGDRLNEAYPYRALLDHGVQLSFGSDIPGEALCNPLFEIHLTVNRRDGNGITPEEALRCYTASAAYAEFAENWKGMIKKEMAADFAVLSDDPTTIDPSEIKSITVLKTVVGGRIVYQAI